MFAFSVPWYIFIAKGNSDNLTAPVGLPKDARVGKYGFAERHVFERHEAGSIAKDNSFQKEAL